MTTAAQPRPLRRAGAGCALLVLLAACTAPQELLRDGGFEQEGAWFWFEASPDWVAPFTVDDELAISGRSLHTHLVGEPHHGNTAIVGAIQEVSAQRARGALPGLLEGWVHVGTWQSDADRAYIQAVVSFFPDEKTQAWCPGVQPIHPCQLAMIIAGQDERPFAIGNRIFVLPPDDTVTVGQWVPFRYDVGQLMGQTWGVDRLDYGHFWVYLEARYETQGGRDVELDVRWDHVSLRR